MLVVHVCDLQMDSDKTTFPSFKTFILIRFS